MPKGVTIVRIFLAGATGAVGRSLVPMLIEAGHEVVGTTRSAAKLEALASAGAEPVVMDGIDEGSVQRAEVPCPELHGMDE